MKSKHFITFLSLTALFVFLVFSLGLHNFCFLLKEPSWGYTGPFIILIPVYLFFPLTLALLICFVILFIKGIVSKFEYIGSSDGGKCIFLFVVFLLSLIGLGIYYGYLTYESFWHLKSLISKGISHDISQVRDCLYSVAGLSLIIFLLPVYTLSFIKTINDYDE